MRSGSGILMAAFPLSNLIFQAQGKNQKDRERLTQQAQLQNRMAQAAIASTTKTFAKVCFPWSAPRSADDDCTKLRAPGGVLSSFHLFSPLPIAGFTEIRSGSLQLL